VVLLAGCLKVVSPVLQTLTGSFCNDTIWFLSSLMAALHLIFHDYNYVLKPHSIKTYVGHMLSYR
jgi:phosphatidylinositol N-acetylglucosaminyltransferase subunit C